MRLFAHSHICTLIMRLHIDLHYSYFGVLIYSPNAMNAKIILGSHTAIQGSMPALVANDDDTVWNRM